MTTTTHIPVTEERRSAGIMLAVAFVGFSTFLDVYATQPLLPRFTTLFHASMSEVGLTVSAATSAVAVTAPFVGLLGQRFRRSSIIVGSLVGLAIATFLASTSRSLGELVFWRFLQGIATPGVYVSTLAYVAEEIDASLLGRAMAALGTGNVIGGWLGRTATGLIAAHFHWSSAFLVLGALNTTGALVAWRYLPRSSAQLPSPQAPGETRWRGLFRPALLANLAIGFNVLFVLVSIFSFVGFHLSGPQFRLGTGALSAVFSVYLVGAVATPIAGRLIDRVGPRKVLLGALAAGATGVLLTLARSLPVVVLGLAVACTACFACQVASTTRLRESAPPSMRSLAAGAYVACYYLGGSIGGIAPAFVWRLAGWTGCVALTVGVQLLTMALAVRFWTPCAITS